MCRESGGQRDLFIEAPVWWEGLTGRRRLFVEYYCADRTCFLNAAAAFIKAYSRSGKELAESSIQSNAARLMRDPKIREAVGKLLRSRQNEEDRLSEFHVLNLLKTLAFYNPKDIVDKYGGLAKSLEELGDLALCVTGIKTGKNGREVKLYDRTKALAMLCEYLKLIRPAEGGVIVNPVVCLTDKDIDGMRGAEADGGAPAEDAEYEVTAAGA